MAREKTIAMTTISAGWKVSLNKDVREILEESGSPLKEGDKLLWVKKDGEVVIRKA